MVTTSPNMRACMKYKRIYLSRSAILQIGNPTHLSIRYDEQGNVLYFSPAAQDDLDAYEIPTSFWTNKGKNCTIRRIAFLRALQYRLGWEEGSKYYFDGKVILGDDVPALAYPLANGVRLR
jgi:hypothetical protein